MIELAQQPRGPTSALLLLVREQFRRQFPKMLPRVVKIDDLNRAREMLVGEVPDPDRTVAEQDLVARAAPAAPPSLAVKPQAKRLGPLAGGGVGGGILVA